MDLNQSISRSWASARSPRPGEAPRFSAMSILAGVWIVSGLACGGSSKPASSDDPVVVCKQACDRGVALCATGTATATATLAQAACEGECPTIAAQAASCSMSGTFVSAARDCVGKTTCADYTSCFTAISRTCPGSSSGGSGGAAPSGTGGATGATGGSPAGTGGATGTGGTSSSVGTGGAFSFDGSIPGLDDAAVGTCADLLNCCNAISDATSKMTCLEGYAAVNPLGNSACAQVYTGIKKQGACP